MRYTFHGGIPVSATREVSSHEECTRFSPDTIILRGFDGHSFLPSVGDKVNKGSVLTSAAETDKPLAISPIHGSVFEVSDGCIGINAEPSEEAEETYLSFDEIDTPLSKTDPALLCEIIKNAGIATPLCPGGAFAVCNTVRSYEGTRRLIIDCSCAEDLFLTNRYIVKNKLSELIGGIKILIRASLAIGAVIITDDSHLKTIRALEKAVDGKTTVLLVAESKYPLSNKKILMHATLKKECPPDKDPLDFGCGIFDAEACVAVYEALVNRRAMTDRLISLGYKGRARVLSVPLGARISDIASAYAPDAGRVAFGAFEDSVSTEALGDRALTLSDRMIILKKKARAVRSFSCIKCLRCDDVCPMYLSPYRLLLAKGKEKKLISLGIDCCIGCNCCSAVCPAGIDIPSVFKSTDREENENDGK